MLGWMYYKGAGVKQDDKEAAEWSLKAAEQGESYAQWLLGILYEFGYGVEKDIEEAVNWYQKAADQGDTEAQKALERLGK